MQELTLASLEEKMRPVTNQDQNRTQDTTFVLLPVMLSVIVSISCARSFFEELV